ncbi:uncharacterized protein LOC135711355 isoform X1 [Ochlerotatus camptorhynchus]|uniref:uncharacterized protein LOC135711355 isoform X1 n=1 Tax=Ochlerotatus camptorhynchus TaxID=644619 RepID=UPI0031D0FFBD
MGKMNSFTIAISARTFSRRRRWQNGVATRLGRTLPMVILLVTLNLRLVSGVADPAPQRKVMELSASNGQDGTDRGHPYGGITSAASSSAGLSSSSSAAAGSSGSGGNADKPYFDDVNSRNVTTVVDDSTVVLKCRVKHKGDRTVSWMRKRDLHILTSDIYTYTGDQRFSVVHPQDSDDWDLKIEYPQLKDSGIYECQVNTEPKINLAVYLDVTEDREFVQASGGNHFISTTGLDFLSTAARAKITGSQEVHVKKGSTISLSCVVNVLASSISWYHGSSVVDFDSARGGISLETEKTEGGTSSRLMLTRATLRDSGNYTCVPSGAISASVQVHVLNGEHPAAMQTSSGVVLCPSRYVLVFILATLNSCNLSKLISFISTLLGTERQRRRRFVLASTAVSLLICIRRRCRFMPSSDGSCTNTSSSSSSLKIRSLSISSRSSTEISSQSLRAAPTLLQKR